MPRLFVAIDLSSDTKLALEQLREESLDARWTPTDQYHLTLRFIGDVGESAVEELSRSLQHIHVPSFDLDGEGLDVFPSRRRPRVLVARVTPSEPLSTLQKHIDQTVLERGLSKETKPFSPHVTFARFKGARPRDVRQYLKRHSDFRLVSFPVRQFQLYKSELGVAGAVHTVLEGYGLGGIGR